jgi:hypothetical protein
MVRDEEYSKNSGSAVAEVNFGSIYYMEVGSQPIEEMREYDLFYMTGVEKLCAAYAGLSGRAQIRN